MFREPLTPLELGDTWSQRWTNFGKIGKSGILLTTALMLNPEFTVSDVQNFWSKLSPTPNELFCLDFFLREDEKKLYRQKLFFFPNTFFIFDIFDHSDRHVIFQNHVSVGMIEKIEEQKSFRKK